ncbi:histone H3.3-like type 1 isoform X7 [Athalia rosae]|uniref:histone H3.3-like type 1 isoform X7 n=1 Tax=Athalia rosae TaxID=37344 RepID=UPI00203461FB|nr:histone H3.3-like type 1 isoform X7 [Athalia rosae]
MAAARLLGTGENTVYELDHPDHQLHRCVPNQSKRHIYIHQKYSTVLESNRVPEHCSRSESYKKLPNWIQLKALEALQEATEMYMVQFFEDAVLLTLHAKRVTLHLPDMRLLRRLRGRNDIVNR